MSKLDDAAEATVPLPEPSPRMLPFWMAARRGRLVLPRCGSCGTLHFPALRICSHCLNSGDSREWVEASGRGIVFSFVVMHQVHHPAFAAQVPYTVVDVKLEEGPRMISRLLDVSPDEIRVGMEVQVAFVRASDDFHLPMFRSRGP